MLFIIDPDLAYELAAVADAASTDQSRPVLNTVKLEAERDGEYVTLRAIATDTYRLAIREARIHTDAALPDQDASADEPLFAEKGNVLVDAKEWKRQLKAAASASKVGKVLMDVTAKAVTFASEIGDSPEVRVPITETGTFPKYRSLVGEQFDSLTDGKLPAFNPKYLASVATIVSAKASARDGQPLRMKATAQSENTELKPWVFTTKSEHSTLEVLLMPVRV